MASNVTTTESTLTTTTTAYNLTSSSTISTTTLTTQQTNSAIMTYPSTKIPAETDNNGSVIGLSIGLTALAIIVVVIALIAWRRKQQKKKEKPREVMPTLSEVDRVIEDSSKKLKKKKPKKGSKHENLAFENEITSSTAQSSHDYENVKNKKEPPYANADNKILTDQPDYVDPLSDDKTMYTSAQGGAEYYMGKHTPVPTERTKKMKTKQEEYEPEDYEEVNPSNKMTGPKKAATTPKQGGATTTKQGGNNLGQSDIDYVNVAGMKKPTAKGLSESKTVYQNTGR